MASHTHFECDACKRRGLGVAGQYLYPDPPLGWRWAFGAELEGPHACSRRCWDTLGITPDGKVRIWDSHEARAEKQTPAEPKPPPEVVRLLPRQPSSWVYFAQAESGGPIKIGMSRNPTARVRELSVASASGLRLLAQHEGGRRDELRLHQQFSAARLHGEWFQPVPELLAYIQTHGRPV